MKKTDYSLGTSITSPNCVDLVQPLCLLVNFQYTNSIVQLGDRQITANFMVPFLQSFGSVEYFLPTKEQEIYFDFSNGVNQVQIRITDLYGLSIINGMNYVIELEKIP